MKLTPTERERLTVFMAAELARRRKERGVRLNHPETVAYVSDWCIERARDGWSVAEIRAEATQLLDPADVMPGVPEMVGMVQVEPVFPDGTKLVTVHDPVRASEVPDGGADQTEPDEGASPDGGESGPGTADDGAGTDGDRGTGEAPES